MNISGLLGTLVPVFFVIALAYLAGKRNAFDAGQVAGFTKLAMSYALPASLFVGMTTMRRDLLLQQGRLFLALILAHVGPFVVAWIVLRKIKSLSGTRSIVYSLILATSGTPIFGLAILEPILRATSAGAVRLVALAIFLTIPVAVVFLEIDAAAKNRQTGLFVQVFSLTSQQREVFTARSRRETPFFCTAAASICPKRPLASIVT